MGLFNKLFFSQTALLKKALKAYVAEVAPSSEEYEGRKIVKDGILKCWDLRKTNSEDKKKLDFSGLKLTKIPAEIGKLNCLEELNLYPI